MGLHGEFKSQKQFNIKDVESDSESLRDSDLSESEVVKGKMVSKKNKKTNFEKFLEMEAATSTHEDLELERELAKKLKVKYGKLKGEDDELSLLFEGIPSVLDSSGEDELPVKKSKKKSASKKRKMEISDQELEDEMPLDSMFEVSEPEDMYSDGVASEEAPVKVPSRKKNKKRKLSDKGKESNTAGGTTIDVSKPLDLSRVDVPLEEVPSKAPQKYVAPHLRSRAGTEPEEYSQVRRRVRGLLNRLSESNVESITGEMSGIFRSIARSIASQIISEEVLGSCSRGPRGNEQLSVFF